MRRNIIKFSAVLAIFCAAHPASAALYCTGKVNSTYVTASGDALLLGDWRGSYTQICNISEAWNDIPPEVCATWIAKVDAAVTMDRTLRVYYSGTGDCASLPTYHNSVPPFYVMLY